MNFCRIPLQLLVLVIIQSLIAAIVGCSSLVPNFNENRFEQKPQYTSQKRIILQGRIMKKTSQGPRNFIYFGYDLNMAKRKSTDKSKVNLIEFKMLKDDGSWYWEPFMIVCDDRLNGFADRLFFDFDLDGITDEVYDVSNQTLTMEAHNFDMIQ